MANLRECGQARVHHVVILVKNEHCGVGCLRRLEAVLEFLFKRQMVLVVFVRDRFDLNRYGIPLTLADIGFKGRLDHVLQLRLQHLHVGGIMLLFNTQISSSRP